MPPDMQVHFLRVLEAGTYQRVGGSDLLRANVRIICARLPPSLTGHSPARAAAARTRRRRGDPGAPVPGNSECAAPHAEDVFQADARCDPAARLARQRPRTAQRRAARFHPV
ncbi:hypothetical protein G6F59_017863 [Rhizopus arrhizus]|nr:hypothetical protein G6F59_017863 [Rhizopus arrhizus]